MDLLLATWLAGEANFNGCTGPGAKESDSKLLHYYSEAGIPMSADECLEADQCSFSDRYVGDAAL